MKIKTSEDIRRRIIGLFLIAVLGAFPCVAQAQQIVARALTPQEIRDYGLPAGTMTSGGLLTAGIGESVYLEAQVAKGTVVTGISWSIESRPLGGSVTELLETPILPEMPIFSPGDREVMEVAGRTLFIPDIAGKYMVKALVQTDAGSVEIMEQVVGAFYTGVGTIDGASPAYPQCALCHAEQSVRWLDTGHATYFERAIDGMVSSHYNENCMGCHVLGKGEGDVSGSFFSTAADLGWSFPESLESGNWAAMPAELKAMANVQCEHCHGAGSEHHGDSTAISVSLSAGDCGQCHDSEPYYAQNREWEISGHAVTTRYPTGEGRGSCVRCHSGIGFIETIKGVENLSTDYEAVTCAVCHDPHGTDNPADLRTVDDVVLENGHIVTEGGSGKICMNCHKGRRDGETYSLKYSSRFSPHYSVQTDMLVGTNAVEYGMTIGSTAHLYAVDDACSTCHMAQVGTDNAAHGLVGGHTFKMVNDNGTPEDHTDDIHSTSACSDCHGPIDSFDIPRTDFNYDGITEGVQTEIKHLLHALAMKLPPIGEPTVSVTADYTEAQLQAAYNYLFVEDDGSHGIHNPRYASGILRASINAVGDPYNHILQGQNLPAGGQWYYSSWFGFYAPLENSNWVYHYEHGMLAIAGDANSVWFFEARTGNWRYTQPDLYPILYDPMEGTWLMYGGITEGGRSFYNYTTGEWVIVP